MSDRNDRDREEDSRQATELRAAQDSQDDAQGMQVNSCPDDLRVHDVILNGPEHHQEKQDGHCLPERVECSEACCQDANRQGSGQGNEFQQTGRNPEHDRVRHADHEESDRADHADEEAGRHLGANVGRQRFVELYKKHVPARPQVPPGENPQSEICAGARASLSRKNARIGTRISQGR